MITRHAQSTAVGTLGRAQRLRRAATTRFRESNPTCLDIGLINNMPDPALNATERQFVALLRAAADDIAVQLTLYTLPEVPRTDFGRDQVSRYSDLRNLWNSHHDGLIITGTEPRAADLKDEPYWESLTKVLEWAESHTYSTILSCLAAHAGILHIDGIVRRPLGDKRFGVFECVRVSDHPLTAAAPSRLQMPQSRWNEIPEEALLACGYRVLTRSEDAGVDAFVKQRKSLFVFFQGHPEYDATTLLLEYRRDIGRFLRRERDTYPPMPQGYFDQETVEALTALRERALLDRREELLAEFPTAMAAGKVTNTWRSTAENLYRNWLVYIRAQKEQLAAK
ncbi:MAG: homoserine O-succinyltransferase [Acidobacteria bacterium]|nr:MAG: homoserine O-succinyltransferase [Acidobacteriota bacterium]